jgi:hypothetical protein
VWLHREIVERGRGRVWWNSQQVVGQSWYRVHVCLHSHRRENLKHYIVKITLQSRKIRKKVLVCYSGMHLLSSLLTPWKRVSPEKLIVAQLVMKSPGL